MLFKNSKPYTGFDDKYFVLAAIFLNTQILLSLFYQGALYALPFSTYLKKWVEYGGITLLLIGVLRVVYFIQLKKYPGYQNRNKRWLTLPLLLIPYSIILGGYLIFIEPYIGNELPGYQQPTMQTLLINGIVLLICNVSLYTVLIYIYQLNKSKIDAEVLKRENAIAQLKALQQQMDPHFLFNSLNTMVYLTENDHAKSIEFLHKLAFLYKRMVSQNNKNLIFLKEELTYIEAYASLLQIRHGTNLDFVQKIDNDLHATYVVPMALQIGIENAVKHNAVSKKEKLVIAIYNTDKHLIIRNNIQKTNKTAESTGQGLDNIAKRYQLVCKKNIEWHRDNRYFELKIPIVKSLTELVV
ncbi:sensor histidine kinase [Croceivirga sp. JEA036]|uniref:sensor histidine kinase n=1 Tax=Croceivirga sp. JEA036 TaxID=2721162 RepID=UPI0014393ACF|nr:histidine kinase [Croceivirga sp. JEA036]NJB37326.1 histidine kinase [Croceivirga sp. JEA036]